MKQLLILSILVIFSRSVFASEVVTGFTDDQVPVLNEELRDNKQAIEDAENRLDTAEDDIDDLEAFYSQATATTLTIASGVVTATRAVHVIDTESAGATDDLDTINGGSAGNILTVYAADSARTVVLKDGTGNLKTSGDCTLDNAEDTATLIKVSTNWQLIACTNNGA